MNLSQAAIDSINNTRKLTRARIKEMTEHAKRIESLNLQPETAIRLLEYYDDVNNLHRHSEFNLSLQMFNALELVYPQNGIGINGNRYSTLQDISDLAVPRLAVLGLTLMYDESLNGDMHDSQGVDIMTVTCQLTHIMGQSRSASVSATFETTTHDAPRVHNAVGTLQYLKRFALMSVLGIGIRESTDDVNIQVDDPTHGAAGGSPSAEPEPVNPRDVEHNLSNEKIHELQAFANDNGLDWQTINQTWADHYGGDPDTWTAPQSHYHELMQYMRNSIPHNNEP